MAKKVGRRRGSRNRGYFFRSGRGWFAKDSDGKFVALVDESGERLRDKKCPESAIQDAYARWRVNGKPEPQPASGSAIHVWEVFDDYLAHAKNDRSEQTYRIRADALFDFATGLPARFRHEGAPKPKPSERIHDGFGDMPVDELKPIHVDRWLQAHPDWKGGKRTKIQALKRAFNYAVDAGVIEANPINGYKTPRTNSRVTYVTAEQEKAMLEFSRPALATAIKVLIRTGARPGREFAALTAANVRDHGGNRMEWVFAANESKNRRQRVIRITDPEVIAIVRRQIKRHPTGPLFRNSRGTPWKRKALNVAFDRLRKRLEKKGIHLDKDACVYALRHSYAKRILDGYWSGKPTSIQRLARLMGNTVQVCIDHYLQWTESQDESLWEAC